MEAMSTTMEIEVGSVASISIASETVSQCSRCVNNFLTDVTHAIKFIEVVVFSAVAHW